MFIFYKFLISAIVITGVSEIAKRFPSFGGLIAAMPITTLLILFYLHFETKDINLIKEFTVSVFWGIFPSLFFFIAAIYFFKKGMGFYTTIILSIFCFIIAAIIHRRFLPDL